MLPMLADNTILPETAMHPTTRRRNTRSKPADRGNTQGKRERVKSHKHIADENMGPKSTCQFFSSHRFDFIQPTVPSLFGCCFSSMSVVSGCSSQEGAKEPQNCAAGSKFTKATERRTRKLNQGYFLRLSTRKAEGFELLMTIL